MKHPNGNNIKKIREIKNISQNYVAGNLGISQAAYSNIENGKTRISREKLLRIASVLDVPAEVIIKFDAQVALEACLNSKNISSKKILKGMASEVKWYER